MSQLEMLMGAAGTGGGETANWIDDVFSTYLYTGNGSTQTITNGIALADGFNIQPGTSLAGGFFAGFISTTGNGVATHAIIVAPKTTGEISNTRWKIENTNTDGTSSVIDGPTNSANMNNADHPAAQFCEGLTIGGFSDWYLPAKNELEVCYFNLKPTTASNDTGSGANTNAVPSRASNYLSTNPTRTLNAAFQSSGSEAFTDTNYWSSTQSGSTTGLGQIFNNGNQGADSKGSLFYVRAVRRVAVSSSTLDPYRVTGKGGLVWIKSRAAAGHRFTDTVRGATKSIASNLDAAEATESTGLTAFNSNGFSIGNDSDYNTNATNYCSWAFAEQEKFFDVVTYTGNGAGVRAIPHSLGVTAGITFLKKTNTTSDWIVNGSFSNLGIFPLFLNSTDAAGSFNQTGVLYTDDNFVYVGATSGSPNFGSNDNGVSYVVYLFASNAGGFGTSGTDNVISCGSYTGSSSVTLGFEPQYIMLKRTDAVANWLVFDNMRGLANATDGSVYLSPNLSNAEQTNNTIRPTATGFESGDFSTGTYIYMAIRRPMKVPTSGTEVFNSVARTGTGANATVSPGFVTDTVIEGNRTSTTAGTKFGAWNRLRGKGYNITNTTAAEVAAATTIIQANPWDDMDGYKVGTTSTLTNASSNTFINWMFKRAPGFHDVVCYTGTDSEATDFFHNLGVVPELIIFKRRSGAATGWGVWTTSVGTSNSWMFLNSNAAVTNNGVALLSSTPTSTKMNLSTWGGINSSSGTYVAYLFATCPGVSKVGSYTGTGATQTINCGFTGGARFVLIKRSNDSGGWYVWDTARGMVAGTDPFLLVNTTDAEFNYNAIYTATTGFQIVTTDASVNASGGSYIFLAIA